MQYDFNSGVSFLGLERPNKPMGYEPMDSTKLYLHPGEDEAQYSTFMEAVSDLAEAFKFLPKYDQMKYQTGTATTDALHEFDWTSDTEIFGDATKQTDPDNVSNIWGQGMGRSYSNLEFSPDASDWNLVEGVDGDSMSILDEVNEYFDWNSIKDIGSGESYYQIAKSGDIFNTDYTDQMAFKLMLSMLESRERVTSRLSQIFGDSTNLGNDEEVITNMTNWLSDFTDVDPHNVGVLKMFFTMQTDFVNTVDAYMNCQTYWGGDSSNLVTSPDLGAFSSKLDEKVRSYISTLGGNQRTAADDLYALWTGTREIGATRDIAFNSESNVYDLGQLSITAGSEKVYVNGTLITLDTDYTIDYSTGQITFSDGVLNSDSVISVDFTYTGTTGAPRYDQAVDPNTGLLVKTGSLVKTEGSWVKVFMDAMDEMINQEVIRTIVGRMLHRSQERTYKYEMEQYEAKKDDMVQEEIARAKAESSRKAKNKKALNSLLRKSKVSRAVKTRGKGGPRVSRPSARRAAPMVSTPRPKAVAHVALQGGAVPVKIQAPKQTPAQRKNDRRVM